jgi:hypothetical protein
MNKEDISVGMVVRLSPGFEDFLDLCLRRKYGEIKQIDLERGERCFCVEVGAGFRGIGSRMVDRLGWFAYDEIKVLEDGWTSRMRVDYLFGESGWHSKYSMEDAWSPDGPCMHSAHDDDDPPNSTRRVLVNAHGCVQEFDVCLDHEDFDGRCLDQVPWGKRWRKE